MSDPPLPNGPLHAAIVAMRQMLLDCFYWQALDDNEGTRQVFIDALPLPEGATVFTKEDLEALRPFAILWQATEDGYELTSRSTTELTARGHVIIQVEVPVPEELANDDAGLGLYMLQLIGRIVRTGDPDRPGIMDLSGIPGRPFIHRLVVGAYQRQAKELVNEAGDLCLFEIDLYWGFLRG